MTDQDLLNNIDSLLFQCALQTRELSQKKYEINQKIKVCRADISETRSNIEKNNKNIKSLEEDIKVKQSTQTQNKAAAKSLKATNSMLLLYEKTMKAELESRKACYNHDREAYEERVASNRGTIQSWKEYYYNNPLAQKLLMLQAENKEIEARIKACDDQITLKQEELDNLTAPVINTYPEKLSESVSEQPSEKEPEIQPEQETHEDDSSFHYCQTKVHPATSEEVNTEETQEAQNTSMCSLPPEQGSADVWGSQPMDDQIHQEETQAEENDCATPEHNQALEEQFTILEIEQAMEEEMEEGAAVEEDKATNKEVDERLTSFIQPSSQETSYQSSPAREKAGFATPTFPFTFSPGRSPLISDSTKSPAFSFTLNSDPNTPGFFGFGIDAGSAQDEDSALPFSSSFFGEKKTKESKTSMEFLFDQPEPSEDFQFSFNTKSPDQSKKDKAKDGFPFSFNF